MHNLIDFKEAFDRGMNASKGQVLGSLKRSERTGSSHLGTILELSSSGAVLLNSQPGEFFKTTVGVRQGCLLSPILFYSFLGKIKQETLHD